MRTSTLEIDSNLSLLQFMFKNSLQDTFTRISNLLKIIITSPMTTVQRERCFSSLKRIQSFPRSSVYVTRSS